MYRKHFLPMVTVAALVLAGPGTTQASLAQGIQLAPNSSSAQMRYVQERNRRLVLSVYELIFNQHQLAYANVVIRPDYIQHNPALPTGRQAFINFFALLFSQAPQFTSTVTQSGADGDRVWVQSHQRNSPSALGLDIIDIYRIQDGKIAEHWDAIEPVVSTSLNSNTQF